MVLYAMRELTRQSFEPLSGLAELSQHAVKAGAGLSTWLPGVRETGAALDLFTRLTKDYGKPAFAIDQVLARGERGCAVTETVLIDEPFCRLLHFHRT
ncbi:hypothetical protein ACTMU2_04815 [Cupriavidus basilensis]